MLLVTYIEAQFCGDIEAPSQYAEPSCPKGEETCPTRNLFARRGACRNSRGAGHVRAQRKDRSGEPRGEYVSGASRRVATRQVISLMQPRRIHPTKCTSLRREGVVGGGGGGGKKGGARREKNEVHGIPTR